MTRQQEILAYLRTVEHASIDDIYSNVSWGYYRNANKYMGEILARMLKNGLVARVKKGVYKIGGKKQVRAAVKVEGQIELFK